MSPDISPVVRESAPLKIIRAAIDTVRSRGITVTTDVYPGVMLASTLVPSWERDPKCERVSPLGAVLLALQPPVPSLDKALVAALDVSTIWILAFEFGAAGIEMDERLKRVPAKLLAAEGYAAGDALRTSMGVPSARAATETTGPMQMETPASVLAQLLDSLTMADVLGAAADSSKRRASKLPIRLSGQLVALEATLREMAEDLRDEGA